jgi:glycosyltransferase involved in cell wall biosynthesis
MRVLGIDARGISARGGSASGGDAGPGAGIAHATRELIEELEKRSSEYGIELQVYRERMSGWGLSRALRRDGISHVLVPSGAVSPFIRGAVFPWIHDLAIFDHPEWFPQSAFKRFVTTNLFLNGLKRAKHIFSVSEDTRRAAADKSGVDVSDITVTYQGIKTSFLHGRKLYQREPYALILGTVEPRKNISFITDLWDDVRLRIPEARIVVAGKRGWGNVRLGKAEVVDRFDDVKRDELLKNASMLLLPSLHEGFGRTALEAMTLGVPVIASKRGAIPEVVGEVGVLLDPEDRQAWIQAIVNGFEGRLDGKLGIERVKRFSWEKTARIMLAKIDECW